LRTTGGSGPRHLNALVAAMGVLLLLGVDEVEWPWLPHRAAPAQQDGPSKARGCARVAEGGTGRRPHARPEAALPPAKPAALTQYRNSSPMQASQASQGVLSRVILDSRVSVDA